jgi:hypothetical protein
MATCTFAFDLECPSSFDTREMLIKEVQRGLFRRPRSLAPWMFYDAHGSRLFERITALPEYYPTRTERNIFANFAEAIITTGIVWSHVSRCTSRVRATIKYASHPRNLIFISPNVKPFIPRTATSFTHQGIRILLEDAGFDVERTWMDDRGWYAVTLARISKKRNQYQADLCAGSQVSDLVRTSGCPAAAIRLVASQTWDKLSAQSAGFSALNER